MKSLKNVGSGAVILFYLVVALEVIVMVTPFSMFFYSLYAPILSWLSASPWTAWLTAFFLPHITYSGDLVLVFLSYLGPILFAGGLVIFLVCAGQVYSAKLFRRGVVSGGLYAYVRHPQYLGLAIAGLGLLLFWPRFFILVTYLTMLFLYYLLAKNEEGRMERQYGQSYHQYLERIPMFLPGHPGERLARLIPGLSQPRAKTVALLYVILLAASIGAALGLRQYTQAQLVMLEKDSLLTLAMYPGEPSEVKQVMDTVMASPQVTPLLKKYHNRPGHTLVAYLLPTDYMMQHLIADLEEHESHHGKKEESGLLSVVRHLGEMFTLKPLRQLKRGTDASQKRVIFTEVVTPRGEDLPVGAAFSLAALRLPLFFADVDMGQRQVVLTMDTPPRHAWGAIPVPAF